LLDPSELFVIEGRAPIIWDFNALGDGIRMTMAGGGGREQECEIKEEKKGRGDVIKLRNRRREKRKKGAEKDREKFITR
jgi:hypothetical protein